MSEEWRAFYIEPHIGNRYSALFPVHWGTDFKKWAPGTAIPSPCTGDVVASDWDDRYGWYVVWKCNHGRLCGRAHMLEKGLAVGTEIKTVGARVGKIGATGSYAQGYHTHAFEGTTKPWSGFRRDPLPHIVSRLADTAGGGTIPIEGEIMAKLVTRTPQGGKKTWMRVNEFTYDITTDKEIADGWNRVLDQTTANDVSLSQWNALKGQVDLNRAAFYANMPQPVVSLTPEQAAAIGAAVKVDLSAVVTAVLDALKTLPESVLARIRVFWSTGK